MTPDNIVEIPWFSNTLPEGAFAVKDDLLSGGRRVVLSPMKRGEAVLRSKITGPGQRASLASLLDEGRRAVTVQVDDVRGVAGFVLPGDFVDIVIIADDGSTKRQSYSDILLEHIKVLAIDQVASEGEGQPTVAKAVTVEVTKEQAQKILLATNIGKLSLILSRPLESKPEPNRRVSEKDIGRTTPEPVRPAATASASFDRRSSRGAVDHGSFDDRSWRRRRRRGSQRLRSCPANIFLANAAIWIRIRILRSSERGVEDDFADIRGQENLLRLLFADFDRYRLGDSWLPFPFTCNLVDHEDLYMLQQNV